MAQLDFKLISDLNRGRPFESEAGSAHNGPGVEQLSTAVQLRCLLEIRLHSYKNIMAGHVGLYKMCNNDGGPF